jgi:hypothetical protein
MKTCIKCNQAMPETDFYTHPRMADGRLNKCKTCCRSYQKTRRIEFPETVREIDRRKQQRESRKLWRAKYQPQQRARNPEKYTARNAVHNALRDGRIQKQNCVVCGSASTQAHHPDYSQPLNVVWVCFHHHMAIHGKTTCTR